MASKYLVSGSTDLSLSASWAASRYGAGGDGVPVADDDVFIVDGSQEITGGLSTLANIDLQSLTIGVGFTGNIGSPGSSAEFEVSNATTNPPTVTIAPGGGAFIYIDFTSDGADDVTVDAVNGANVQFTGGTIGTLKARSGDVTVQNGCDVTTLYNSGAGLEVAQDGTAITTYAQTGGSSSIARAITTGTFSRGPAKLYETTAQVNHTTLSVHGSMLDLAVSGTVTTLNVYDGMVAPNSATVSPSVTTLNRFGGTTVDTVGSTSLTITTDNDFGGKKTQADKGAGGGVSFGNTL